ncbi:MAG: hypothetical protein JSS05_07660 [Proteobacteria bacterium]|nr:hypothetical protein [Pseudomonadota bacterium]
MDIASVQATRKRRPDVKVAVQAAPINENSQLTRGEHDPATRAEIAASSESAKVAAQPT